MPESSVRQGSGGRTRLSRVPYGRAWARVASRASVRAAGGPRVAGKLRAAWARLAGGGARARRGP